MSRWKQLPDTLDERARHLVVQLRRLKDRSGLSLVSLGRKTAYSRSSWERYLNGKALPPRQAVEQLARLGGTDPTRLLVLHELAEAAVRRPGANRVAGSADAETGPAGDGTRADGAGPDGGAHGASPGGPAASGADGTAADGTGADGTGADGPGPAASPAPHSAGPADALPGRAPGRAPGPEPAGGPEAPRRRSRAPLVAGLAVAAVAVAAAVLVAAPWEDEGGPAASKPAQGSPSAPAEPSARAHDGPYVYEPGRTYHCDVRRENGLLGAGHSATRDAVLQTSTTGWDVVEAQCLLKHHGFSPGGIDGIYGDLTTRAVKRIQDKHGLVVDGKVGPHTWGVLRG